MLLKSILLIISAIIFANFFAFILNKDPQCTYITNILPIFSDHDGCPSDLNKPIYKNPPVFAGLLNYHSCGIGLIDDPYPFLFPSFGYQCPFNPLQSILLYIPSFILSYFLFFRIKYRKIKMKKNKK